MAWIQDLASARSCSLRCSLPRSSRRGRSRVASSTVHRSSRSLARRCVSSERHRRADQRFGTYRYGRAGRRRERSGTSHRLRIDHAAADVDRRQHIDSRLHARPATTLDVVQVTATGQEQSRRESGVSTSNINVPEQVPQAAVSNLQTVSVARGGRHGAGGGRHDGQAARIRIRGSNSVSLSQRSAHHRRRHSRQRRSGRDEHRGRRPGAVAVERHQPRGHREHRDREGPGGGGAVWTAASNGVIQITTKHGRSGRAKWAFHTKLARSTRSPTIPRTYSRARPHELRAPIRHRLHARFPDARLCAERQDRFYNPLQQNSPFIRGWRERYGADVNGGSDVAQYYIGGDFYREQGVYAINRSV